MYSFGLRLGALCALIPLRGLTLSWMWLWFVVPLGVPAIGWAQATGLCLVTFMLLPEKAKSGNNEHGIGLIKDFPTAAIYVAVYAFGLALVVGTGWVLQGLMQ